MANVHTSELYATRHTIRYCEHKTQICCAISTESLSFLTALDNADTDDLLQQQIVALCHMLQIQRLQFIIIQLSSHIVIKGEQSGISWMNAAHSSEADVIPIKPDDMKICQTHNNCFMTANLVNLTNQI